jgi:aminopeptidase N
MIRRFAAALLFLPALAAAQQTGRIDARQPFKPAKVYTKADSIRGMNGVARAWWDVQFYDLHVRVDPNDSTVAGYNTITYKVLKPSGIMQIDLQKPLEADSIMQDGKYLTAHTDGNVMYVQLQMQQKLGARNQITIYYHGKPRVAKRAPWDGGLVWATDSLGARWIATAVEGLGASAWWPLKDYLGEEPDSQRIAITVPDSMKDVSNGRLRSTTHNANGTTTYEWFVVNPINSYNVEANAGNYGHFSDTFDGEKGKLTLDYWPLAYHTDTAKVQFAQSKSMLKCFEHWFGPYPWYEDGYKLIETPHLGMEHQSGVAYGNHYKNGYLGRDLSATGWGLKWDFIIVHESAHEWWGNNVSAKDHADMWVHESFANYAEGIYTECQDGKKAGAEYIIGSRHNISNDEPIIPAYGVNAEGSGDMYYKGGSMLHMIRQIIDNDEKWRAVLRGVQSTFWHQTVTGKQVEAYISKASGIDFSKVFEQYLTTTMVPTLEYKTAAGKTQYRWTNVVPGFAMPVRANNQWLRPTSAWKSMAAADTVIVDPNFYVFVKPVP